MSVQVRKIPPPPGFDPRNIQPVASRYTDWAIPAHLYKILQNMILENKLYGAYGKFAVNYLQFFGFNHSQAFKLRLPNLLHYLTST